MPRVTLDDCGDRRIGIATTLTAFNDDLRWRQLKVAAA